MSKIPTAKKFLKQFELGNTGKIDIEDAEEAIIEFAKLHVEVALKEASEKVEMIANENQDFRLQNCNCVDYLIDKNSILNVYPLENVK